MFCQPALVRRAVALHGMEIGAKVASPGPASGAGPHRVQPLAPAQDARLPAVDQALLRQVAVVPLSLDLTARVDLDEMAQQLGEERE